MYTLSVKGIDGEYTAVLSFQGTNVDTEVGFKSTKDAEKWGHARAELHSEVNRPSTLVHYEKSFAL